MPRQSITVVPRRRNISTDLRAILTQVSAASEKTRGAGVSYLEIRRRYKTALPPIEHHRLLSKGLSEGYLTIEGKRYRLTAEGENALGKKMDDKPVNKKGGRSYLQTRLHLGTADPDAFRGSLK
jgi:hypothetical protein